MTRKCVVLVPSEEDFKARQEAQQKADCKDVPDNAVMEMKGTTTKLDQLGVVWCSCGFGRAFKAVQPSVEGTSE